MKVDLRTSDFAQRILASRGRLMTGLPARRRKPVQEGGCGVVGFAASVPVPGRHIFQPSIQMHNRGNGKGGGIAAAGFQPEQLGVDAATLRDDYILQIALLDPQAESEVEETFVSANLNINHKTRLEPVADYRDFGLEVRPPDVVRYFVRAKDESLARFAEENNLPLPKRGTGALDKARLSPFSARDVEDELIYQNSFRLNKHFYAALGEKRAFVLSHARNLMVFKIVGYAEHVVQYYGLEDFQARVWIAHQRYPTKGRVWHPAGSHPFIGMNEALVHNGDFANYFSISEYLRQHNIAPLFLTDTEVSVLLFDLWSRTYGYSTEHVIEALAPTTELDFDQLPDEKKKAYRAIQALHMHGSPDGPWFFIIVRSDPDAEVFQLLGITDTSMLRPQVFALQEGEATIGLVASEKQAIDATLHSLAEEDSRFRPVADVYWNARGGSHTDGGAFVFTVSRINGQAMVSCTDKFGSPITSPPGDWAVDLESEPTAPDEAAELAQQIEQGQGDCPDFRAAKMGLSPSQAATDEQPGDSPDFRAAKMGLSPSQAATDEQPGDCPDFRAAKMGLSPSETQGGAAKFFEEVSGLIASWDFHRLRWFIREIERAARCDSKGFDWALELLAKLNDRRYDCGRMKRSAVLQIIRKTTNELLDSAPPIAQSGPGHGRRIDFNTRRHLRPPQNGETTLIIFAQGFPPEGDDCEGRLTARALQLGWKRFIVYGLKGQRFTGCGLGPATDGVRIDVFGSSGDYLASGIDGMQIHVHGSAQDQIGQIIKRGTLVVYGDVGQTFMYGAKGGEVYIMGNAAGRPLINAAGRPRVVINGTCLDYLAESFMAGDPHRGGGFVILNGVEFDHRGRVREQPSPYPGSNLFSLASGGAIFVRDPHHKLVAEQLNGGEFAELTDEDWHLILPYLEANQRHFGISIEDDLLTVDGHRRPPQEVYRKVRAVKLAVLAKELVPE